MSTVIPSKVLPVDPTRFAHDRIQQGVALHTQIQNYSNALTTIVPQATQLRYTANALWQAIEVQYSSQTETDVVPVVWMQMSLPRSEWRQRLAVLDREATTLEHQRTEIQTQNDALKTQLTSLQRDTIAQLRQLYAAHSELPATTVEFLTQVHAQHLSAAISDWDGAIAANASAQKLVPSIELKDQGILFQAFLQVRDIATNTGNLDKTMTLLESILSQRTAKALTPVQITTLLQAQHLHAALFAAKAPLIQATQGASAFDAQFQLLKNDITQFEKRIASPEYRDATASAHLQLVRVLWAAHRYQEAFAEAAQVQRKYAGTSAAKELDASQCWLYHARPEAYAPGGLIRENLSEISFSGLGASAREAWAHTNENSSIVQYGLPTLGCVAGAVVASKLGAAAGTTVGPEGTVLGFGAGAATGCGLGAVAGKVVDWAASAITAPEVAQALLTGVSDETLGMTWVRMNFAALELATTYYLGKSLWSPALGLAQGGVDVGAGFYKVGRYVITQPGAAVSDLGTGLLTTTRVSGAIAETLAQTLANPVALAQTSIVAIRSQTMQIVSTIRNLSMDTYAHAASVATTIGLAGVALYPTLAVAKTNGKVPESKMDMMISALLKPGPVQWGVSIPIFFLGSWVTGRMFFLDKLFKVAAVQRAINNEMRTEAIVSWIKGSQMTFGNSLFQASIVNLPWIYQQAERNNVKPLLMAIGSFSDVLYPVGSKFARIITEHRNGKKEVAVRIESSFANWLRKKNIANLQMPVMRNYVPFFGWNLLFSQLNNQTLGRFFTDGELIPWVERNAVQPIPMFPQKLITLFLGIDTPAAMTADWYVNTMANTMLTWFFPPWINRRNWRDDFVKTSDDTTWATLMDQYATKMEHGVFQIPHGPESIATQTLNDIKNMLVPMGFPKGEAASIYGARSIVSEYKSFFEAMVIGDMGDVKVLDIVTQHMLNKARPASFKNLPEQEKHRILMHLALIIRAQREITEHPVVTSKEEMDRLMPAVYESLKANLEKTKFKTMDELFSALSAEFSDKRAQMNRLEPQARKALVPHLKLMGFQSIDEILKAPVEEIVEHLNDF